MTGADPAAFAEIAPRAQMFVTARPRGSAGQSARYLSRHCISPALQTLHQRLTSSATMMRAITSACTESRDLAACNHRAIGFERFFASRFQQTAEIFVRA